QPISMDLYLNDGESMRFCWFDCNCGKLGKHEYTHLASSSMKPTPSPAQPGRASTKPVYDRPLQRMLVYYGYAIIV
ncbi:MAG: hypothetical protein ACKPKO_45910, partial [Candidatus Fonsibacter sp.]